MLSAGLKKIWLSFCYSFSGLKVAFVKEQSFRWEVVAGFVLIPLAMMITNNIFELVLLVGAYGFVLVVELLNSAIEVLADKVEPNQCMAIKHIKDMASAAVFVALAINLLAWLPFLSRIL